MPRQRCAEVVSECVDGCAAAGEVGRVVAVGEQVVWNVQLVEGGAAEAAEELGGGPVGGLPFEQVGAEGVGGCELRGRSHRVRGERLGQSVAARWVSIAAVLEASLSSGDGTSGSGAWLA